MKSQTKNYIFLDIDGVLATNNERYYLSVKKYDQQLNVYGFDKKCVKVFNEICAETNPIIILSSDWQHHYTIEQINDFFERQGITHKITDFTGTAYGDKFTNLSQLEECRAYDIVQYAKKHKIKKYLAIDDLNLSHWLDNYFIHTPRAFEGIKQSGIKDKILSKLLN